jgi:hypothetical protein
MYEYRAKSLNLKSFKLYIALKLHFTSNYDFIQYHGKTNIKPSTYHVRNDKSYFAKLAKHENPIYLLVSNFIYRPDMWIGDIVSEEGQERYLINQNILQSLTYHFENDIVKLYPNDLKCSDQFPNIVSLVNTQKIHLETLIVLVDFLNLFDEWNTHYKDNILWENLGRKIKKYTPFVFYDKNKIQKIITTHWIRESNII